MKAAFSGALGPEMKTKAKGWAKETPDIKKLPARIGPKSKVRNHVKDAMGMLARGMKGLR